MLLVRAIITPNIWLKEVRQVSYSKLLNTVTFEDRPEGPLWLRARALELNLLPWLAG